MRSPWGPSRPQPCGSPGEAPPSCAAREQGLNPAETALEAKRLAREAPTVAQLADDYVEHYAKRQKKSWQEDERVLDKEAVPTPGSMKARGVRRRLIIDLLEEIVDRKTLLTSLA